MFFRLGIPAHKQTHVTKLLHTLHTLRSISTTSYTKHSFTFLRPIRTNFVCIVRWAPPPVTHFFTLPLVGNTLLWRERWFPEYKQVSEMRVRARTRAFVWSLCLFCSERHGRRWKHALVPCLSERAHKGTLSHFPSHFFLFFCFWNFLMIFTSVCGTVAVTWCQCEQTESKRWNAFVCCSKTRWAEHMNTIQHPTQINYLAPNQRAKKYHQQQLCFFFGIWFS